MRWFTAAPDVTRTDLTWYIDGSQKYGHVWELRRTGCALVVVSAAGDLVAFGNAVPPRWVRTSAGAELWSLMLVLTIALAPPPTITDCMSILTASAAGSARAQDPRRPLAQIWSRIGALIDDDVSALTSNDHLVWMPAHGGLATIGRAVRSDGVCISAIDWRANRLADALAKAAIGEVAACARAMSLLKVAEDLVRHECAVLGSVTHAANNHPVTDTDKRGRLRTFTRRDSTGLRRATLQSNVAAPTAASSMAILPEQGGSESHSEVATQVPTARHPRPARRAAAARAASVRRQADEAAHLLALCNASERHSSSIPPAHERLAALRARVLVREQRRADT